MVDLVEACVAGLHAREIYPRNHFSVHHKEQAVTCQKFRQVGIGVFTRNNLVHCVADGFQPLKLLNLTNHGGLIHVDQHPSPAQNANQVQ